MYIIPSHIDVFVSPACVLRVLAKNTYHWWPPFFFSVASEVIFFSYIIFFICSILIFANSMHNIQCYFRLYFTKDI